MEKPTRCITVLNTTTALGSTTVVGSTDDVGITITIITTTAIMTTTMIVTMVTTGTTVVMKSTLLRGEDPDLTSRMPPGPTHRHRARPLPIVPRITDCRLPNHLSC